MIRIAVVAVGLSAWAATAFAQSATEPARRGGLLPSRAADPEPAAQSREELARRWDLNADGQIDDAEAEIARAKMRRERRELRERSQVDPLTGRPRGAAAAAAPADDELVFPDPAATAPSEPPAKAKEEKPSLAPREIRPGAAAAATPPKRDLNAGRPLGSLPNAAGTIPFAGRLSGTAAPIPGGTRGQPQAGARTGTARPGALSAQPQPINQPSLAKQPPMARPARPARPVTPSRPAPTLPARPRVSAEEIGGP